LLVFGNPDYGKKEEPPGRRLTFDNPKTNLTYEKNLYLIRIKYHAKSESKISTVIVKKK
jgi:hypothetical protein